MALPEDLPVVRLDGQVALVTGAGRGIGRAIALALGGGAAVAVCARSKDEVTSVAGPDNKGRRSSILPEVNSSKFSPSIAFPLSA